MELFKVTCVTCQAKLSVRNAALIGEIVACPRCESMVLVEAPAIVSPALAPVAQVEEIVEQSPATSWESSVFDPSSAEPSVAAELASVSEPMAMAGNKAILWWIASFAIGASVTSAFLVMRQGDDIEPAMVSESLETAATEISSSTDRSEPTVTTGLSEENSTDENPDRRSPGLTAHEQPTIDAQVSPSADSPTAIAVPPAEVEVEQTVEPVEIAENETPVAKLVVESPTEVRVARKFDPLRYDLEQMDVTNLGPTEAVNESKVPLPPQPAAETDGNLGERILLEKPAVVRLSDDNSTPGANRSAESQLKHVVHSLAVKDMLLTDYLDLIGSISGAPISVGPLELQMAGISPSKHVSQDVQEIPLAEALAQVLKPLRLEASTLESQVVIVREDAARVRSIDYPLDDLLGSQTSSEDYAEWIEKLVAPETWVNAGGSGKITKTPTGLSIEQTQRVHYQILFFLERIRLAKQMPLRSRYPAQLLDVQPLGLVVADRLSAPSTFTFSHETSLVDVFRYWQSELGLAVLVDWPELAKARLWPDSRVTCSITNEPWHVALDAVLTPLDLGWRASPGGTIQITSQASLENDPILDIYPADLWQDKPNSEAIVVHDPANKLVYFRAPATLHRAIVDR